MYTETNTLNSFWLMQIKNRPFFRTSPSLDFIFTSSAILRTIQFKKAPACLFVCSKQSNTSVNCINTLQQPICFEDFYCNFIDDSYYHKAYGTEKLDSLQWIVIFLMSAVCAICEVSNAFYSEYLFFFFFLIDYMHCCQY